MTWRVGTVDYLNSKPLTWAAEQGLVPELEVVPAVPSKLAAELLEGRLDAAIVSSVLAFEHPELRLLEGAGCIAANGPVQSVLLFTRVHLSQVASVALDTSSLSSVALVRILLEERYGLRPTYLPMPPDLPAMLEVADAALLIGDPGLSQWVHGGEVHPYDLIDLGREWKDWTGLPFVFAVWLARPGVDEAGLTAALARSRDLSRAAIETIAAESAPRLGLPATVCEHYLAHVVGYHLGEAERRGLDWFHRGWRALRFRDTAS